MRCLLVLSSLCFLLVPALSAAQFFDNAQRAINVQRAGNDFSGQSLRGAVDLSTGAASNSTTIFRGQASIGGSCGAFDFASSYKEVFETLPSTIYALVSGVIRQLPMIALCELEPVLCDQAKHFQALMNAIIQARFAQCQSAQNAAKYIGGRLHGGQISQCLERQQKAGASISSALDECYKGGLELFGPDGVPRGEVNLVADSLDYVGASDEVKTVAKDLMGDITLRGGNGLGVNTARPSGSMEAKYESHKQQYADNLRTATTELRDTGRVAPETLRSISVPGQPMSRGTVDALAAVEQQPDLYAYMVGGLSTTAAITKLTWECTELEAKLQKAMSADVRMGDAERATLEEQLKTLRQELAHLYARTDAAQKHGESMNKLMREFTAMQETANALALRAPAITIGPQRYGRQNAMGYSR